MWTYKLPVAKTNITPIFCLFLERRNCARDGIGSIIIAKSVAILNAPLKNHRKSLGMQLPLTGVSQKELTGRQFKKALRTVQSP